MKHELYERRPQRGRAYSVKGEGIEGHDRWLISYADLVTLLFALFVVLYVAADHDRAKRVAQSIVAQIEGTNTNASTGVTDGGNGVLPGTDSLVEARAAVDRAFAANETLRSRARVTNTERGIVISLAEAGFFAASDATVRTDALHLLDSIADTLKETNAPVRVEGHTDSTPIASPRYPSNWELSAARASNVLARLIAREVASARLSLAGYADQRPIADNSTAEGRALNRRVDIVILRGNN